jgi:hypothetical protein
MPEPSIPDIDAASGPTAGRDLLIRGRERLVFAGGGKLILSHPQMPLKQGQDRALCPRRSISHRRLVSIATHTASDVVE